MKIIKAFLYCFLWFTLAFLFMLFIVYKEYKEYNKIYNNTPTIIMRAWTWDLTENKLPTFEVLTLSFPWHWDDKMYNCDDYSNITVKTEVVDAKDEDGMVSKLLFYYYNVDDPSRILDFKETWITNPYAYFSIPKVWWEYKFWVKLYDNNGWIIDSEEYLWSNPIIYIPSCSDAPLVTLRLSNTDIEVWDAVVFTVISRSPIDSEKFEKNLTFYYDFTWDWTWDLITWNNVVDYVFNESYSYWVAPRAAVEYRWKVWIWDWEKVYVGKYNYTHWK